MAKGLSRSTLVNLDGAQGIPNLAASFAVRRNSVCEAGRR